MTTDTLTRAAKRSRWLWAIAASAAVAIWSGWVSLGQAAGFGMVQPLPGILPWHLDTAITLPVGIEAYGAFALGAWLSPAGVPVRARAWARNSAIGALCLGMAGQVASHLLAAAHTTRAPWPVTVLVSCVPVVTLGFAAALTHLLRSVPGDVAETYVSATSAPLASAPVLNGEAHPERTRSAPRKPARGAPDPLTVFASELDSGALPSLRQIRSRAHVGQERARGILADLERAAARQGGEMAAMASGNGKAH